MKTKILTLLIAVAANVGTLCASIVNGTCGENLTWSLNTKDSTFTINGSGAMYNYDQQGQDVPWGEYKSYIAHIVMPDGLTSIGDFAFYDCSALTSVTIPNSVIRIGIRTFANSGLTSLTLPNSVTNIGNLAFSGCDNLSSFVYNLHVFAHMPRSYSGAYTIPEGIESIAGGAFQSCHSLTSVTIPSSVTSIGGGAFYGCSYLTSIEFPNSVTSIEHEMFYKCTYLTSVTIPNSVTSIGDRAFQYCTHLTSITIPNSVTSIGRKAFSNCTRLTSVAIGNNVTSIGKLYESDDNSYTAFESTNVNEIHFTGNLSEWIAKPWHPSLISSAYDLYIGEDKLTNLIIADGTVTISSEAFHGCTSLSAVTIPTGVKIIEENAFSGCSSIQAITSYDQRPPTVKEGALDGIAYSTIVYVPEEYLNTYIVHDVWGLFDVRPLDKHSAIEGIEGENIKPINKFLRDGQVLILRGDKTYTLIGQEVK